MSTTSTDPIADMLTRIRNAIAVRQHQVTMPHSAMKESIAKLLVENKYVQSVKVETEGVKKNLIVEVSAPDSMSPITEIKRLSKPGRRMYVGTNKMPIVKQGRGIVIVSTSQGLMTGSQAKAQGVGGELLCLVY